MTHDSTRRAKRRILGWTVAVFALTVYVAAWLAPATWWYEPKDITIRSRPAGVEPEVSVDRVIHRSFYGRYTVSVWRNPPGERVACAGSDDLRYKGGLSRPQKVPLTQWADDPFCGSLPPGDYYAEACWTVLHPFGPVLPEKTVCLNSNVFTIDPRQIAAD